MAQEKVEATVQPSVQLAAGGIAYFMKWALES